MKEYFVGIVSAFAVMAAYKIIQSKKVKERENDIKEMVSRADNDDESSDKDGFCYGKNAISGNYILLDRKHLMPPHGLIVRS